MYMSDALEQHDLSALTRLKILVETL